MSGQAVISCPFCLRQYAAEPTMNGKLGQCGVCKAQFIITVVETASSADGVIVFDEALEPRYNFLADGCAAMAKNVSDQLMLAKLPITLDAVREIVRTIPRLDRPTDDWRGRRCIETLDRAHGLTLETSGEARMRELTDYFFHYIPTRNPDAINMLQGAFVGVLGKLVLDTPEDEPQKKRGWLERLAARRGW